MRVNVDKVLERDQKLSELDDRADALQAGASQFETSAAKLKNKYWWKNAKVSNTLSVSNIAYDLTGENQRHCYFLIIDTVKCMCSLLVLVVHGMTK